nr:hypothetical protein [Methanobrevibacter arboriphilus]
MKKNNLSIKLLTMTLIFVLILITISSVSAIEIDNSTDLKQTITNAPNGSTINLDNGTYKNNVINIVIDKNLTIQGKDPENTIIDAQKLGKIFLIREGNTLTLINVTLINGNANSGGDMTNNHGGIIFNYGTLEINNCIFKNNSATGGGAIASFYGDVNIYNSIFIDNSATYGGGFYSKYSNNINIINSNFNNNSATYGGGGAINCNLLNNVLIINSTFTNNTSLTAGGGAINNNLCRNMNIVNSRFINNTNSYEGGGAIYNGGGNITINNSNFTNNTARPESDIGNGGAIYNSGNIFIFGSNFISNIAKKNGGAIYNIFSENMSIINSIFIDNSAENGGAIYNNGSLNTTISNSIFLNNTAEVNGSAIYNTDYVIIDEWFPEFSMIYNSSIFINNSTFINNNKSAIYNTGNISISNSNLTKNDLAVYTEKNTIIISSNIFENYQGISINSGAENIQIIYNRIFNNTNSTGYNLDTSNPNINVDYNWWGSNSNPNSKINGTTVNSYYTVFFEEVKNKILATTENHTFKFSIVLNGTNDSAGFEKLPKMLAKFYNNDIFIGEYSTDDLINVKFSVDENKLLFIIDDEIYEQNINLNKTEPINPEDPKDPTNPTNPKDPTNPIISDKNNSNDGLINNINNTSNDTFTHTAMKETGIPIILILVLLSSLGLIIRKKQ